MLSGTRFGHAQKTSSAANLHPSCSLLIKVSRLGESPPENIGSFVNDLDHLNAASDAI
jgi:hypothetical protein